MASLNQCNFIGNLGKDPEMRTMTNGKAVTNFSIAVTEKWTSNGEKKERTEWVKVTAYDKLAEICAKYLAKGKPVFISGKMQTRSWEDKDGNTRYTTEIVANNMVMLYTTEIVANNMVMLGMTSQGGDNQDYGQTEKPDYTPQGGEPGYDSIPF
jgi:single-strand DNA-binding protein